MAKIKTFEAFSETTFSGSLVDETGKRSTPDLVADLKLLSPKMTSEELTILKNLAQYLDDHAIGNEEGEEIFSENTLDLFRDFLNSVHEDLVDHELPK